MLLPGTGLELHYASNRVEGYYTMISVPASGTVVPSEVKRIIVEVDVAGRILKQELSASPEQIAEFMWDGLDFQGMPVENTITAKVKIGYVYDTVYTSSDIISNSLVGWAFKPYVELNIRLIMCSRQLCELKTQTYLIQYLTYL